MSNLSRAVGGFRSHKDKVRAQAIVTFKKHMARLLGAEDKASYRVTSRRLSFVAQNRHAENDRPNGESPVDQEAASRGDAEVWTGCSAGQQSRRD